MSSSSCSSNQEQATPSVSTFHEQEVQEVKRLEIGADESRKVFYSKFLVVVVLCLCAGITAWKVYDLSANDEQRSFEIDFNGIAAEIATAVKQKEENIIRVMELYSAGLTSTALAMNQTWPRVVIPDIERKGAAVRKATAGLLTNVKVGSPGGSVEAAEDWNDYYNDHLDWYNESCKIYGIEPVEIPKDVLVENEAREYVPIQEYVPDPIPEEFLFFLSSSPPLEFGQFMRAEWSPIQLKRLNFMRETHGKGRSPFSPIFNTLVGADFDDPTTYYYEPIFDTFEDNHEVVGFIELLLRWMDHFVGVLHNDAVGIIVVLESTCDQVFTYMIIGETAEFLGPEDLHDPKYNDLMYPAPVTTTPEGSELNTTFSSSSSYVCGYSMRMYPSDELREQYKTSEPALLAFGSLLIFAVASAVFVFYDLLVQRRQRTVLTAAEKTEDIVSSLFPSQFRDQLIERNGEDKTNDEQKVSYLSHKSRLRTFAANPDEEISKTLSLAKPVADLFLHTTVMFADIVGFTAWSSIREPTQVFTLLESIYSAFDKIAKRHRVFKVESVGDCYVAACGVPEPRQDHALALTRFARDCMFILPRVVLELERFLGPGTGDIAMRFGLHSGPVTAGVLRGEKVRFQLFGDTVNTTARLESTGRPNCIHLSSETAKLLIQAGKSSWVVKRQDLVSAKGKGDMQTYWLKFAASNSRGASARGTERSMSGTSSYRMWEPVKADSIERLVEWNVEVLLGILKQVVVSHAAAKPLLQESSPHSTNSSKADISRISSGTASKGVPLDEVSEIIMLPGFDRSKQHVTTSSTEGIDLGDVVEKELYHFVTLIASAYPQNPFHNFEHASHVAMSVNKLLSRIVAPDVEVGQEAHAESFASKLHDNTYGITSDPLTQFSVVLSALVHDVEHPGVPNGQLGKEKPELASKYKNKSLAEQNSVDVAWELLMQDDFANLRNCIYRNNEEYHRFRQIVVNNVLATDIFDPELGALRQRRWNAAFQETDPTIKDSQVDINRKATIVIEYILQASDVSHTMQHWHVYTKWNERLFQEMYLAYKNGRSEKDPSTGWYKGEIWFFDNYILPLAKKLDSCGVFGVSSDEYLNWALQNRSEWESKGQQIVADMTERCKEIMENSNVADGDDIESGLAVHL